ncbi:ornithine decarboxylase [Folsomia candida]|uniref:ornithine decarboxylase n=1 Tax=Folsomia candida TaxID=158441 RepID=A0A226F1G4_FOLCA|nr:ornithine decarboxylase [Folsomia candida]XP_035702275.1 ornithine decarboxylase [Folsomia candida]OXA63623.1 Ornithine decarboxylase [Folsomia candida]
MDSITYFDDRIHLTAYKPRIRNIANELTLAKVTEEAFFICDLGEIIKKHEEWISQLPRVQPHYAVKCNDSRLVLQTLAGLGTGFDCASKAEMRKVLDLGVNPSRIIFANPTKQNSHVRAAAENNVVRMTFDNEGELHKIKALHPRAQLVIRIRCDAEKAQCQLGMKFGVLVEEAPDLLEAAHALGLDVIGVSFHVGSGCMDPPVFDRAIKSCKWLFGVGKEIGFEMNFLDIGGGFPGNTGTSIKEIASVVNGSLAAHFPEECGVEIIAEPGRFYVASAFTLTTLVHSIREIKGNETGDNKYMYYINDGVYGSFNCVIYDHAVVHPELLKNYEDDKKTYESSIWGPTCDGLDNVCPREMMPKLDMGDWLLFRNMGAYTLVAGGTFNGFPTPKIYFVASYESWCQLKEFMNPEEFVTDNVPILMKAGVGCNRDAVGWASVAGAAGSSSGCLNNVLNVFEQPLPAVVCDSPNNTNNYLDNVFQFPANIQAQ